MQLLTREAFEDLQKAGPGAPDFSRALLIEESKVLVARGEMSLDEFWAKAEESGIAAEPNSWDKQQFSSPFWPLALALAWISARNASEALRQWRTFRHLRQAGWKLLDWSPTAEKLVERLVAGDLDATGIVLGQSDRVAIPAFQWIDFRIDSNESRGLVRFDNVRRDSAYEDVRLCCSQVKKCWPTLNSKVVKTIRVETDFFNQLCQIMTADPCRKSGRRKDDIRALFPDVFSSAFIRAWAKAVKTFPAWSGAGRRRKSR